MFTKKNNDGHWPIQKTVSIMTIYRWKKKTYDEWKCNLRNNVIVNITEKQRLFSFIYRTPLYTVHTYLVFVSYSFCFYLYIRICICMYIHIIHNVLTKTICDVWPDKTKLKQPENDVSWIRTSLTKLHIRRFRSHIIVKFVSFRIIIIC